MFALEGLADTNGKEALPVLLEAAITGISVVRARALEALGKIAEKPAFDPCDDSGTVSLGSHSSIWGRPLRPLYRSCESNLSADERKTLIKKIRPFLSDPETEVKRVAKEALERIQGKP